MQTNPTSHRDKNSPLMIVGFLCILLALAIFLLGIFVKVELSLAIIVDCATLMICAALLLRHGRLSAMHPATTYLFFHVYVVTLRLAALALGAETLPVFRGAVTLQEIARASVVADLALLFMTAAWIRVARKDWDRNGPLPGPDAALPSDLNNRYFVYVAIVTFVIGVFGLTNFGYSVDNPNVQLGAWTTSNYLLVTVTWSYLAVLLLIYIYGFKPLLLALALISLGLMIFNSDRFVLVMSTLYMCYIYLSRRKQTWFRPWMLIMLLSVAVIWIPLKIIARDIRNQQSAQTIISNALDYYNTDVIQEGGGDTQFLDMAASVMTLVDEYGQLFYGRAWLPIATVPIPRQLWPDKPRLSDYLWQISTPDRPMAAIGMVPTLFGDGYVNFGYIGTMVVPYIVAYAYGWGYFKAFRRSHYSLARFTYIVFACSLIQVFRDGVMSIVLFSFIAMMPMAFVILLHLLLRSHKATTINTSGAVARTSRAAAPPQ